MKKKPTSAKQIAASIAGQCYAVRLRMLNRVISGIYDEALRPLDLRVSQLNVLVVVARRQPVSPAEVAALLRLEKSTLSRNLERMVKRGWLANEPGRPQRLRLTRKGERLIEKALPLWEEAQRRSAEVLGRNGTLALSEMGDRAWARQG